MSWNIKAKLKQLVQAEEGTVIKDFGGKTTYLLVYPNTYYVGMSNLGVHNVYRLLNDKDDIVCERAFLAEKADLAEHKRTGTPILSVESQRPAADFDVVAFSCSFENDLQNIRTILNISKLSKGGRQKLIIGGAVVTLNPKKFEKDFDEVITGDFEKWFGSGIVPARNAIWTRNTEFGSMHLVEVQRGCPHKCKFCSAPVIYHPFKQFSKEEIIEAIDIGLPHRKKIGLIGGDIFSHPNFVEIAEYVHSKGATFSPSSVRADRITPKIAELLKISGHKTITLAPETGSEELRRLLGKNIGDEKFFSASNVLSEYGITQLKLYFMIGLPNETAKDVEAISSFVKNLFKSCPKVRRVTVAVNPFVPKPRTAFEKERFEDVAILKDKVNALKRDFSKINNVTLKIESPLASLHEYEAQFL